MMRPGSSSKRATLAALALLTLSTDLARGAASTWKRVDRFEVRVDSGLIEDAKVYEGDRPEAYLLDLPSEPTLFLIDVPARTVFAVRREHAVASKSGATVKAKERFAWSTPLSSIPPRVRFTNGATEVQVIRKEAATGEPAGSAETRSAQAKDTVPGAPAPESPAPPGGPAPSGPATPPGSPAPRPQESPATSPPPGPDASRCVSLDIRPATGVPGCTRFVYVRNTCDAPVVAVVQRTERLMTGTLPQSFTVTVPHGEQLLGCSWWSGAMAPSKHELLGATYLQAPPPRIGQHPPKR